MAASFVLPYGRARNRTRRIRSETLWINRDKAVPSYTFKNNGTLHLATAGRRIIGGKDSGVKGLPQPKRRAVDCPPTDARALGLPVGRVTPCAPSFSFATREPREDVSTAFQLLPAIRIS